MPFECQRCGTCCRTKTIDVSHGDIKHWWSEKRYDILREIAWVGSHGIEGEQRTGGFYVASTAGKRKGPCVFLLGDSSCGIYGTRPRACRDVPYAYDEFPGCPAFVHGDISPLRRSMVRRGQEKDYRRAFFGQQELYGLLVKARRRFDTAQRTT